MIHLISFLSALLQCGGIENLKIETRKAKARQGAILWCFYGIIFQSLLIVFDLFFTVSILQTLIQ